jgi:hypothetical protein
MKKIALAGLIAISMIAVSQQHASAWVNSRFGVGLNWSWQGGGNNILWGAVKGGQPPGPEAFGDGQYYSHAPYYSAAPTQQFNAPMPQYVVPQSAPSASYAQPQGTSLYQFANYPRPVYYYYYYPAPAYYYYSYDR